MLGGVSSVFGEPDQLQTALRDDGMSNLLVVGSGQFCARLTQVTLHDLHLSACDEQLPRIAFVKVPANIVLVSFLLGNQPAPLWGGIETRADEMITLNSGEQVHARTEGRCSWGMIRLPREELVQYGRALRGVDVALPPTARWRPGRAAFKRLRSFHLAAVRTIESRSGALADRQAAHGLKQQVIHALIECLSAGIAEEETPLVGRHRGILARFEDLLQVKSVGQVAEMSAALGISERMLLACCNTHLGMGPHRYCRLRRIQQVHSALRRTDPRFASVSDVARQYGIRDLGRFAANYHDLYGELPSDTLRGCCKVAPGRLCVKFNDPLT